jgi:predicted Holliday junction resolvase-like endonuclease
MEATTEVILILILIILTLIVIIIQFHGYVLTCRLNSSNAYYKASTKTQIKHKNSTNTQKQNTKQTKQKQHCGKKQYKRSMGAKTLHLEKTQTS